MRFRAIRILCLLLAMMAPQTQAAAHRDNKATLSFHMQAQEIDNPKMIFKQELGGKTVYFRRMPELATKDFASFTPFLDDSGNDTYGLVLRLKPHTAKRLLAITNANQGNYFLAMINGRIADVVLINDQVSDGVLVIWRSITQADIDSLEKVFPRTEDVGKKKK